MALSDHLRELRARLIRSIARRWSSRSSSRCSSTTSCCDFISEPYDDAVAHAARTTSTPSWSATGIGGRPAAPAEALRRRGDRRLRAVLALPDLGVHPARACTRRSASGRGSSSRSPARCSSSGWRSATTSLPKGLEVLIGFTPDRRHQPGRLRRRTSRFVTRMLLVFGIAFEIPLFVILLNLAGVVSGKTLGALPAVDHHRHLRLRRGRDAVHRPVLDADAGHPDARSSSSSPRSSRASSTAPEGAAPTAPTSGTTTSSRRSDEPTDRGRARPRPVRPARLAGRGPGGLDARAAASATGTSSPARSAAPDGRLPALRPAGRRRGLPGAGRRRRPAAHGPPGVAARRGAPGHPRRPARPWPCPGPRSPPTWCWRRWPGSPRRWARDPSRFAVLLRAGRRAARR